MSQPQTADWRDQVTWPTYEKGFVRLIERVGAPLFALLMNVDCRGAENVPASGGCIVAANHLSSFDPVVLGLHLPRHPFFMAKQELFRNPVVRWYFRQTGTFPVKRGKQDAWALRQAGRILQAGQMLCMFPEGTRSKKNASLKRGKSGTVKLALDYGVPIVPAALTGTQKVGFNFNRTPVSLSVGQPLPVKAMAGEPPYTYDTLRELTVILMKAIAAMLPPENRGRYGE